MLKRKGEKRPLPSNKTRFPPSPTSPIVISEVPVGASPTIPDARAPHVGQEPRLTASCFPPFPRPRLPSWLCRVLATAFCPGLGGQGASHPSHVPWPHLFSPVALKAWEGWVDTPVPGSQEPRPAEILSFYFLVISICPASTSHALLGPIQSWGAGEPVPGRAPQLCREHPSLPWVLVPWGRWGPRVARREPPAGLGGTARGEESPGPATGKGAGSVVSECLPNSSPITQWP